jgi:hypothetical protein
MRLEDLERQTRKQTVKDAHATIIMAEKIGINADQLREMLVEINNWDRLQTATKDLKAKVELEAMKAQVKADSKQDISQALDQTGKQTMETSSMLNQDTFGQTASETSLSMPFVETVAATARAADI